MRNDESSIQVNIGIIKSQLVEINKKLDGYIPKIDKHESEIVELQTKLVNFNSFQTFLTFIGTTIATALAWFINKN